MTDYRDDWKYSRPVPREPSRKAYEDGWERVFGAKRAQPDPYDAELKLRYPNATIHVSRDRKP